MLSVFRRSLLAVVAVLFVACSGDDDSPPPESRSQPTAVARASALAVTTNTGATLQTALGATVALDATGSTPGAGSIVSTQWVVTARPAGSVAAVTDPTALQARFAPDVVGDYAIELRVADSAGGSAVTALALTVGAAPATPSLTTAVTFEGPSTTAAERSLAVGSPVTLDASASNSPAGGALQLRWEIATKPAGSNATLEVSGLRAVFTPDIVGVYEVRVRGTSDQGSWAESRHPYRVDDGAPRVLVSSSVSVTSTPGATINAAVGNLVALQGYSVACCGLSDAVWTIRSKPFASGLTQLTPNGGSSVRFVPDAAGAYVIQLAARAAGGTTVDTYTVTVNVVPGPQVQVSASVSPVAAATVPSYVAAPGQPVVLRGTGSNDPAGGVLSYAWRLLSAPQGNSGGLVTPSASTTSFTPTAVGRYEVELTVTTSGGLSAVQNVVLLVGATVPTALVERSSVSVLVGQPARISATPSSSASGNTLTYSWAIDARPAGSTAAIADASAAQLSFTPDVAGLYSATVTVSDGPLSAVAPVTILALSPSAGIMPLSYVPLHSRYNRTTGKLIIASSQPDALHIVDPVAQTDQSVALPAPVKGLSVSPSGRWAAVLHDNTATVVDLSSQTVVRSFFLSGAKSDLFMLDTGAVVLAGVIPGSSFSNSYGYMVVDGASGNLLQSLANSTIYQFSTFRVAQGPQTNRLYAVSDCCSSAAQVTSIDPTTSVLTHLGGSTQGNLSSSSAPAWLTSDEAYSVSTFGTLLRTSDFATMGNLFPSSNSSSVRLLAFSHSAAAGEAVGLEPGPFACCDSTQRYPSVFKRWTGDFFFAAPDQSLPTIDSQQSYGLAIFHMADNRRLAVVQTGGDRSNVLGLRYFAVIR